MAEEEFADNFDIPDFADSQVDDGSQDQQQMPEPQPVQRQPLPPRRAPQRRPRPPVTPQMAAAQAQPLPQQIPQPQQAIQHAAPAQAPAARFIPYEMPKRIGLLDRETGRPVIEDEDMMRVIMAQLADIKNDIEELKSYYA